MDPHASRKSLFDFRLSKKPKRASASNCRGGSTVLARGVQDVSREWFELSQKRLQMNLDGLRSLAQCRSVPDFMAVQASLIRDNLEQTLDTSRRMAELTQQLAEASRTVTVQAEKSLQRVSRAA